MRESCNRRTFIGAGAVAVSLIGGRPARAAASERVRVAVIGLRNRGTEHARMFAANPHAEVVAICDVDDQMIAKPAKAVEAATGKALGPRKISAGCSMTSRSMLFRSPRPTTGTRF